ncbi:MAG: hypothetical protein M3Z04_04540 [Chloroflexota bacterium]|nr:hypothetical protein [Chloroflexota bacterium]
MRILQSVQELLSALIEHPNVLGIVEFGCDHRAENFTVGDYDVLVILKRLDYQVTSIHFDLGNTPVDLNIRSIEYLRRLPCVFGFERAFVRSRLLYDPTGEVGGIIQRLAASLSPPHPDPLTEHEIARIRHWHRHILDKIGSRVSTQPTLCDFILYTNIFWLVENYFRIHRREYEGPTKALDYLESHEPAICAALQDFYAALDIQQRIQITQGLTERILQPIGGMWKKDEILAFGEKAGPGLQRQGQDVFNSLFGKAGSGDNSLIL